MFETFRSSRFQFANIKISKYHYSNTSTIQTNISNISLVFLKKKSSNLRSSEFILKHFSFPNFPFFQTSTFWTEPPFRANLLIGAYCICIISFIKRPILTNPCCWSGTHSWCQSGAQPCVGVQPCFGVDGTDGQRRRTRRTTGRTDREGGAGGGGWETYTCTCIYIYIYIYKNTKITKIAKNTKYKLWKL